MEWYYTAGTEQRGPINEVTFRAHVDAGEIRGDTLVWNEGLTDWVPYAQLAPPTPAPARPALPPLPAAQLVPSPSAMTFQRLYFQYLLVEIVLGLGFQFLTINYQYGFPIRMLSFVMQGVFWIGIIFGVASLREQRGTGWTTIRMCTLVPLLSGLAFYLMFRVLGSASFGGPAIFNSAPIWIFYAVSLVSRAITLGCAFAGLHNLRKAAKT